MNNAIKEVLREFHQDGLSKGIARREIEYFENLTAAMVENGMLRLALRRGMNKFEYVINPDGAEVDWKWCLKGNNARF